MAHRMGVGVAEVVQDDGMSALDLNCAMLLVNLLLEAIQSHLCTRPGELQLPYRNSITLASLRSAISVDTA